MSNRFKKYITFFLYACFIFTPTLYWIKYSWGMAVLSNFKTFFNLISNDLSFLLTVLSVIGALITGFVSIITKEDNLQAEQDIYPEEVNIQNDNEYSTLKHTNSFLGGDESVRAEGNIDVLPPHTIFNISDNATSESDVVPSGINLNREPIMSFDYDKVVNNHPDMNYFDNILKLKGYRTFDVKIIEGFNLLFFAVSNKNILFGYDMPFVGEIITNEIIPDDSTLNHPLWFSHMHRFMSPIFAIKEIRQSIDSLLSSVLPKDHDITIESYCILDDKAVILNIDEASKGWGNDSINVVMRSKSFKTIPSFNDVLEDNSMNEILPSFLEFAETLEQYYIQKARISALKRA